MSVPSAVIRYSDHNFIQVPGRFPAGDCVAGIRSAVTVELCHVEHFAGVIPPTRRRGQRFAVAVIEINDFVDGGT